MKDEQAATAHELSHVDFHMTQQIPSRAKSLTPADISSAGHSIPQRGADVNEILRCICESFLISVAELTGKARYKNICEARIVAYWLLRELGGLSYPEIGMALKKDHTSAMSGFRRCVRRRALEPAFLAFTDELQAAVAARMKGDGA